MLKYVLALILLSAATTLSGCQRSSDAIENKDAEATQYPGINPHQEGATVIALGDSGALVAYYGNESLERMASKFDAVVIATVLRHEDVSHSQEFASRFVDGYTPPTGAPEPTPPMSQSLRSMLVVEVRVEASAAAPGAVVPGPGEHLLITSQGGYWDGVIYDPLENPLLAVGETYLIFVGSAKAPKDGVGPSFTAPVAYGKMLVDDDGRLRSVWRSTRPIPYFAEIEGERATEILDRIRDLFAKRHGDTD